jgi:hypothetical protein
VNEQTQAFVHDNQNPFLDSEHKIKELHFAIKNLRVQSSPGRDGIDCLIIRNLPNEALEIFIEIYNDILRARVFPDDWKYRVLFIPKRDKMTDDKHAHILVARKQSEILRSTDNLAIITTDILKVLEERNTVSALFLDIKSAYYNVHCGTLRLLRKSASFHL